MNRGTRILGGMFGVLIAYALFDSVVYPHWVEPLVTIDERVAERQRRYDELKTIEDDVRRAKGQYQALVSRVGSFDIGRVETEVRDRLNKLIEKHGLQDASTAPSRPKRDQKTKLTYLVITVKATGTLQSAIEFLRDVAELPQLARITSPVMYPASQSRKSRGPTRMNMRVPVEILVLPQQKLAGSIKEEKLVQAESFVRHRGRDYSPIWDGTPFDEHIDYKPLKVDAGKDINRTRPSKRQTSLSGKATGGDGQYTYKWEEPEGLSDASAARPKVDISASCNRTYTLTVTDGRGMTATDTVRVVVEEGRQAKRDKEPLPPEPVDPRWKDRKYMQAVMTLINSHGADRVSEFMVYNKRNEESEYYSVGQDFDGGVLVCLHPTGGLVCRNDDYFIYPIGGWLDQDINVGSPDDEAYPELRAAADRHRDAAEKAAAESREKEKVVAEAERKATAEAKQEAAGGAERKEATAGAEDSKKTPDTTDVKAGGEGSAPETDKTPNVGKSKGKTSDPKRGAVKKTTRPGGRRSGVRQVGRPDRIKPADSKGEKTNAAERGKTRRRVVPSRYKPNLRGSGPGVKPKSREEGTEEEREEAKETDKDKGEDKDKGQEEGEEKGTEEE